jgi:hypothetical protein
VRGVNVFRNKLESYFHPRFSGRFLHQNRDGLDLKWVTKRTNTETAILKEYEMGELDKVLSQVAVSGTYDIMQWSIILSHINGLKDVFEAAKQHYQDLPDNEKDRVLAGNLDAALKYYEELLSGV